MPITFHEVLKFAKQRKDCFANDADFEQFCAELEANPTIGVEVPNAGGARKARWADIKRGKGKSGGLRIYYYFYKEVNTIYLFAVYNKNTVDLTPVQRGEVAAAIQSILTDTETKVETEPTEIEE